VSISRFQEKFLNQGCLTVLGIGIALVFVLGTFTQCNQSNLSGENRQMASQPPIATVKGAPIPAGSVAARVDNQLRQYQMMGGSLQMQSMLYGGSLTQELRLAAFRYLAEQNGIKFTDDAIRAADAKQFDAALEQQKQQFIMGKQLKENATPKEFDDLIKKQYGKTVEEIRAARNADLEQVLQIPSARDSKIAELAQQAYMTSLAGKVSVTDDMLKTSYTNFTVKRILIKDDGGPTATTPSDAAKKQADKILAELKGGKKFEEAMNAYSTDAPQPKKKVADLTQQLYGAQIVTQDNMRPIASLKPGEITDAIKVPEGTAIFKLISSKVEMPKDFDKNKDKYRKELAEQIAGAQAQKQVDDLLKSPDVIKWNSDAYKQLYAYSQTQSDPALQSNLTARQAKMREIFDAAKADLQKGDPDEQRVAALVQYNIISTPGNLPMPPDAAKARDEQIDAMEALVKSFPDYDTNMKLVDLYLAKRDEQGAVNNLLQAASMNHDVAADGERKFHEIAAGIQKLKGAGLLKPENEKQLQDVQQQWLEEQKLAKQAEVERKQREIEDKRRADAEKAALKKQQSKAPGAPTPSTTQAPTTGSSTTAGAATTPTPSPTPAAPPKAGP